MEYAALECVDWLNDRKLLEPIDNIPPVERERTYYMTEETPPMAAGLT